MTRPKSDTTPRRTLGRELAAVKGGSWGVLGLAAIAMVVGALLWVRQPEAPPTEAAPPPIGERSRTDGGPALVAALAADDAASRSSEDRTEAAPAPRNAPPWLFRIAASFIVGFVGGFLLRSFLKLGLLLVAGLLLLGYLLQRFGVVDLDPRAIEARADDARAWIGRESGAFRAFLREYASSTIGAVIGIFFGFRRG